MSAQAPEPFWLAKSPGEMSEGEWESLCDGCGKCCCFRLEEWDDLPGKTHGRVHTTDVACRLLDRDTARCSDYAHRKSRVPDCVKITPATAGDLYWLPQTCAYRLVAEGRDLPTWHPLKTGDPGSTLQAGYSVAGATVSEDEVEEAEHPVRITVWPGEG